jgi:hypothetical protein
VNLLAVWAFNQRVPATVNPNPATTLEAIEHYRPFLTSTSAIVAGDFNANVRWDDSGRYAKFAEVDSELSRLGLTSAYHGSRGCALGNEPEQTLIWQKNVDTGYHVDYVYLPKALVGSGPSR